MTADLLRLLEAAHPGRPQADLLAMIDATPDAKPKSIPGGNSSPGSQKPVGARRGSRPRTDSSMERRRSWAASGHLPPKLAARFTLAEHAVLAVIGAEVAGKEACTLTLEHIAALAGVCRSTVKNALREAQGLGFIRVEERRLSAWRNLPHRITVTSPEWSTWLRMRARARSQARTLPQGGGVKSVPLTNTGYRNLPESRSTPAVQGYRQSRGAEPEARRRHDSGAGRTGAA